MYLKGHLSTGFLTFSITPLIYTILKDCCNNNIFIVNLYELIFDSIVIPGISQTYSNIYYMLSAILLVLIGSWLPDIDFQLKHIYGKSYRDLPRYHRQVTHSLLLNIAILLYAIYSKNFILFWIWVGVISHLIGDMITGSIPILLYGRYGNWISRVGIDRFYKSIELNRKIAQFFNRVYGYIIIISLIIMLNIKYLLLLLIKM